MLKRSRQTEILNQNPIKQKSLYKSQKNVLLLLMLL